MQLWASAILFTTCVYTATKLIKLNRTDKKEHLIVMAVILSLLSLVLLAYFGLSLILIYGIS